MPPYAEKVGENVDHVQLAQEIPEPQRPPLRDTPSPPGQTGTESPPLTFILLQRGQLNRPLAPLLPTEDGLPYDHTLPHFIRQVTGEENFNNIERMTLRILTATASLQQLSFYTPNIVELNLDGSVLSSLRDIGCELQTLHVLRVNRCSLTSLSGSLGLTSLRELYAAGNAITCVSPCSYLTRLQILDLSRNRITDHNTLTFLSFCTRLRNLNLNGNSVEQERGFHNFIQRVLPGLIILNHQSLIPQGNDHVQSQSNTSVFEDTSLSPRLFEKEDSVESSSSRVSSAGSSETNSKRSTDFDLEMSTTSSESGSSGASRQPSVSRLTSGNILYGNLAAFRKKFNDPSVCNSKSQKAVEASRRWRAAYYKFRSSNASMWAEEQSELPRDQKSNDSRYHIEESVKDQAGPSGQCQTLFSDLQSNYSEEDDD